ncbi:hypothetical protein KA005_19850 [bacterium]|nr:hypothetical protein [bacterium]
MSKKYILISIGIAAFTLIFTFLMFIQPYVIGPALEQNNIVETLDVMLDDVRLHEESKNYEKALSICDEAYVLTYEIKREVTRKIYQCSVNLHQAACYINSGSLEGEKNKVNKGLKIIEQIFVRIETIKEKVKPDEIKPLIWWANYYRDFAISLE